MDNKIESLNSKIGEYLVKDFNFKMQEILSFCESPIEKLLLLHLYYYFISFKKYDCNEYHSIDFIEDLIYPHDKWYGEDDRARLLAKIEKYKYREYMGGYSKYKGFKAYPLTTEGFQDGKGTIRIEDRIIKNGAIYQEFEVYPQYPVSIDNKDFRIDIAIILNRKIDDKIVEKRKIAIECDGFEFHSKPEKKKQDDIRARKLKVAGWREVFRYSGSELNGLNEEKLHPLFKEIEKMFYV